MPQNVLPPSATDSSESNEEHSALVERLAGRYAGPTLWSCGDKKWDQDSVKYFVSSVFTALRLNSSIKLDQAFDAFGGPPPQCDNGDNPDDGVDWNASQLLFEAARDPNAFGFEFILNAQQDEHSARVSNFDSASWLRGGLTNSIWDRRERRSHGADIASRMALPIKSCFARDNPSALAKILKDPTRFAALASFEPKPNLNLPGIEGLDYQSGYRGPLAMALMTEARSTNSCYEISLLWEAIHCGSFRCAALLAALPAFNQTLTHPRGFAAGVSDSGTRGIPRSPQNVFEEAGSGVEFSLFESAVSSRKQIEQRSHSERSGLIHSWLMMIESMVDHASPEAKAWTQEGTGMGWNEILFARREPQTWGDAACRGNDHAEREIAEFMNCSVRLEEAGFKPQWAVMADASSKCTMLKEWMQLREATACTPELKALKRKSISL